MNQEKLKGFLSTMLYFVVTVGVYVIAVLGIMVASKVFHWTSFSSVLEGKMLDSPLQATIISCVVSVVQNGIFSFVPLFMVCVIWKRKASDAGLISIRTGGKELVTGLLVGIAAMTFTFVAFIISGSAKVKVVSTQYLDVIGVNLISYILVGFGEEIFFRGGMMYALKWTRSKFLIVGISSILFGCMHLGNNGVTLLAVINLIGFGVVASYCFYRSGSIWLPIGMHITWNFFMGCIYGFPVSGTKNYCLVEMNIPKSTIVTGGSFGPESGIAITFALILIFLFVRFFYRNETSSSFENN